MIVRVVSHHTIKFYQGDCAVCALDQYCIFSRVLVSWAAELAMACNGCVASLDSKALWLYIMDVP